MPKNKICKQRYVAVALSPQPAPAGEGPEEMLWGVRAVP
jgi:hypothetical protein